MAAGTFYRDWWDLVLLASGNGSSRPDLGLGTLRIRPFGSFIARCITSHQWRMHVLSFCK